MAVMGTIMCGHGVVEQEKKWQETGVIQNECIKRWSQEMKKKKTKQKRGEWKITRAKNHLLALRLSLTQLLNSVVHFVVDIDLEEKILLIDKLRLHVREKI